MSRAVFATPIVIILTPILTPLLMRWLSRKFPVSGGNFLEWQSLHARYNALELGSQLAAMLALVAAVALLVIYHVKSAWQIGAAFGWLVITPLLVIALFTLPRGVEHWREFWRFYKLKYRISLHLLAPLYALIAALGLVSTGFLLLP